MSEEEVANVFWDYLRKVPGFPDRRATAWGSKTKKGLALTIKRLAAGLDKGK